MPEEKVESLMLLNPMWVVGAAEPECEGLVTKSPWRDGSGQPIKGKLRMPHYGRRFGIKSNRKLKKVLREEEL